MEKTLCYRNQFISSCTWGSLKHQWATAHLICGECYDDGEGHICLMVAVSWGASGEPAHAGKVAFRSAS